MVFRALGQHAFHSLCLLHLPAVCQEVYVIDCVQKFEMLFIELKASCFLAQQLRFFGLSPIKNEQLCDFLMAFEYC